MAIRIVLTCNLKMMQEASKRRCNKIKFTSLSFLSKLFSEKILIKNVKLFFNLKSQSNVVFDYSSLKKNKFIIKSQSNNKVKVSTTCSKSV